MAPFGEDYVAAQQVVISLSGILYMVPQASARQARSALAFRSGGAIFLAGALYFRCVAGVGLDACCLLHRAALGHLSLQLAGMYNQRCGRIRHCRDRFIFSPPYSNWQIATQCIASYALRGYKVTKMPMFIHAVVSGVAACCLATVCLSYADMGIYGFWTR